MSNKQLSSIQSAVGVTLETLERRQLLHAGIDVAVNFQPTGVPTPSGMIADTGATYGSRSGYVYGWNADNSANARDRNTHPDQRYDSFNHLQKSGSFVWEMALENGDYKVRIVAGDAGYFDSNFKINAEGVLTVNGTPSSGNRFVEGTQIVTVNDGRLTISSASGAVNNKIAFVEIQTYHAMPVVSIAASQPNASEPDTNGQFVVTRTGSVSSPLVVNYFAGGSATAGSDYAALGGQVTIPAGENTAVIDVNVLDDSEGEQIETVALTLSPDAAYEIDQNQNTATVSISDEDSFDVAAANVNLRFNFQTGTAAVPDYYRADTGAQYGLRANGLTYGWTSNNSANARQRNASPYAPDQRYLSFNHMQKGGDFAWELAVPNGTYAVRVVAGESDFYDSVFKINVEGVLTVNGTPTSGKRFVEGSQVVSVTDGRLTISNASGAKNNKIAFIEIRSGKFPTPEVAIHATDTTVAEQGSNPGMFTVSRSGDKSQPLVVNYSIGGTATNGVDYAQLFSTVTIPAGESAVNIKISPVDDTLAEGGETVILTILPSSNYSPSFDQSASVTIQDNDTNVTQGTLQWSTKAAGYARAEALRAVVGGKLYVLGGYIDGKYLSSPRMDVYDPASNKWTQLGNMPQGLTHAGTANDDRYIYVAGGYTVNSAGTKQVFAINNVRRYDTQTGNWTSLPNLPEARGGGALALAHGKLYYMGGSDINRADKSNVWELNLSNTGVGWKSVKSLPQARNHFAAVTLDGHVYAVAGQTGQDAASVFKREVYRYDHDLDTWTQVASLINEPRSHNAYSTVIYGGKIIVMGGETDSGTPNKPRILRNVEMYDPATNKWSALTPLPSARTSGVAGVIGDKLIYAGGSTGSFQGQTWVGQFV